MELDLNLANKFAKCANLAYQDQEALKGFKELGYTHHIFLEHDEAQCHVVWNKEEAVIAFRGTEPDQITDILADLKAWPKKSMTDGWVHAGFRGELDKLWDQVKLLAEDHSDKRLYICGHSLGAAMATICTSRVEEFRTVDGLYTFGSPRAGTRSFVKGIRTPHWRFVNNNDVVTRVPLALMGYKHHGQMVYINHYGKIRKMTSWQRVKDKWRGWKSGLLDGVQDHGMPNYVNYTIKED